MALWMDNNSIADAITSLNKLGRDNTDWKKIGMYVLVGLIACYLVYVFMV